MGVVNKLAKVLQKRHVNYITNPIYEQCSHVIQLPIEQRCEFVTYTNSCKELAFKLDCAQFMFCTFEGTKYSFWFPLILLILACIVLIYLLNLFITKFFVNTTLAIGRMFHFNEYLTGVIVVTIANTLYNFYWVFYSTDQDFGLIYNATVGTALIDFGVLVPIIIFMAPHKIIKDYMLIDGVFIIVNFIWLDIYFAKSNLNYLEAILLSFGYVLYIIILWIDSRILFWKFTYENVKPETMAALVYAKMPFKIFSNMKNKTKHTDEEDLFLVKARRYALWFNPAERGSANQFIFKQFKDDLLDFQYTGVSTCIKIKRYFDTPFVILFRFVMPVIDLKSPCHKWSKLLRVINVILFPFACWISLDLPVTGYLYYFCGTVVLAVLIFFTSRTDRAPEYYSFYGLCVFFGYTFITFGIMSEVENIISTMFMLMNFDVETIGHLAIAIFDIIPDVSLAINMVQRGYPKVAWSGCFATVIFRGYFEMGIRFYLRRFYNDTRDLKSGAMGPTGSIFGILQMTFLCFGLQITNCFTRRGLAYFLILSYVTFLIFSLLVDKGIAHGYGTSHLNEDVLHEEFAIGILAPKPNNNLETSTKKNKYFKFDN